LDAPRSKRRLARTLEPARRIRSLGQIQHRLAGHSRQVRRRGRRAENRSRRRSHRQRHRPSRSQTRYPQNRRRHHCRPPFRSKAPN
jgi:hypothetical protein